MRRTQLAFLAPLALAASLAAGCIITTDGDNVVTDGVFHTTWTLSTGAGATTCQAQGADKVSFLFTARYDGMGFDELFDCFDFAGNTNPLPLDDYTYVATLLDCPDTTPGCPGGDDLGHTEPLRDTFDTCNYISGETCFVNLPTIDFVF